MDVTSGRSAHGAGRRIRRSRSCATNSATPTPDGAKLVKTGNPDAGLEWYVNLRNGVQWGWQAKFTFDVDTLLKLMEKVTQDRGPATTKVPEVDLLHSIRSSRRSGRRQAEVRSSEVRGLEEVMV